VRRSYRVRGVGKPRAAHLGRIEWLNRIFHFRPDTASAPGGEGFFLRNHALSHVALNTPITLRVQLKTDHSLNIPLVVAQIA